ncbi:MAG: DUF5684 domain-containing protein [Candidatus Coproplasma sp.]
MNFIEKLFPELAGQPVPVVVITLVITLAVYILIVAAEWKMFTKMGEKGWKSLIPVYNLYILLKRCSKVSYLWQMIAGIVVIFVIDVLYFAKVISVDVPWTAIVFGILELAALIWVLVLEIKYMHGISKSFGHGAGFTVGLILLTFIFSLILSFGSSQYKAINQNTEE